ncbi:MAG: hypothetical protein WCP15_01790 [bacterium]
MSKFNTCVLISRNGLSPEELENKADAMLAKFDINTKTEPIKSDNNTQFDAYSFPVEVKPEDYGRLLFGHGNEEKIVKALINQNGEWIDGPYIWMLNDITPEQKNELDAWEKKLTTLFKEQKDAVVFLSECHM